MDRLRERKITRDQVCDAIENPDETGLPTWPGRERVRWSSGTRHAIDVVYEIRAGTQIRIITAIRVNSEGKDTAPTIVRFPKAIPKRRRKAKQRKPQRRGRR